MKEKERTKEVLAFLLMNNKMETDQSNMYRQQISSLIEANQDIQRENDQLKDTIEIKNTQMIKNSVTEKEHMEKYDLTMNYFELLGITLNDIKRNFNHGLLYIIMPGTQKKLLVISTLIHSKAEQKEINQLGKPLQLF